MNINDQVRKTQMHLKGIILQIWCFAYMYVQTPKWCPQREVEDVGTLGPGITDGCEPPCGSQEQNLGPP